MRRHFWVLIHRYAGLYMAFFLLVAGLTGSIMAFEIQIQNWLNSPVKVVPQANPRLDALTLRERALTWVPQGRLDMVSFTSKPDEAYTVTMVIPLDATTGKPEELLQLSLNPYTGKELAREKVVAEEFWPITRKNFIPFIIALHYRPALPGSVGIWLFGIAALLWTLDCFVGAYLTFPLHVRRRLDDDFRAAPSMPRRSWWSRWKPSWLVKWRASAFRVNFDLHRAGGLWVWLMLLVLAWSSVGLNLGEQVYTPVMKAVFNRPEDPISALPSLPIPQLEPALGWQQAYHIGQRLMAEQANIHKFKVQDEMQFGYFPEKAVFWYAVTSDRDITDAGGGTFLVFDGTTGKLLGLSLPTGQNVGTTLHNWIFALHFALIWGLPFKIFVCLVGIVTAMLSITGVYIWLKKRRAARLKRKVLV